MDLVSLTEKEFTNFAYKHEQASFLQTLGWGKLKVGTGWKMELVGFKDKNKVIAAAMLLSKMTPIKKKMFYAPHGFIIDYSNYDLLDEFISKMKMYVKKNNGIFFKIDPYVMKIERDIDGNVVKDGIDNTDIYNHLRKIGFREVNGKKGQQTLQSKWLYRIDINGRSIDDVMADMTSKTRQMIRKNEKNGIVIREASYSEMDKFKKIMDHTSERREFLARSLKYYQDMYNYLNSEGICKMYFASVNLEEQISKFKEEINNTKKEYDQKEKDFKDGKLKVNEKKFIAKQNETKELITRLEKKVNEYKRLKEENKEDVLLLGAIIYMIHGNEVVSLVGGAYSEYLDFQPFYSMHDVMIRYAVENNYRYYNFYGISGNLVESDPMYGVYLFKKGFGGQVVELLGEFDYPINKLYYFIYRFSYYVVHKLKKLKFIFKK